MPPPSASSTADALLQRDLLVWRGLRMRVHRIALAHWQAGARLRSWGVVPLHRIGDRLLAPCAPHEALWLGFWQDADDGPAVAAELRDDAHGARGTVARIAVPPQFQITALNTARGVARAIAGAPRRYALHLDEAGVTCALGLQLQRPHEWAQASGRPPPPPLAGPPPPVPRYG